MTTIHSATLVAYADHGNDGFNRAAWAASKVGACPAGAAPVGAATYAYDGLDRQRHNTDPALGTTVVRRDGWGSAVTVETGGTTPGQAHYALGPNGESFMLRHAVEAEVATHHLHDDGFGTTATVTDGAGAVACSALHDSYGGPQQPAVANPTDAVCNTGQTVNNVWYRGARRDDATGTYQFGSRTYDPAKAGWHTPDSYRAAEPSADLKLRVDPLTQNSYSYVNGDPVNQWDPSGHSLCSYIRGSQLGNQQVVKALTADGSNIADWAKYTSQSFQSPSGPFQVHFYRNSATGAVNYAYDYKVVFNGRR